LQRSALSSTPLTLDIRVPYLVGEEVDEDIPCEDVESIFQELDRHKGRWENVTIHWHWHSYRLSETLPSLENLPMLQKLDYLELIPGSVVITPRRRRVDLSTMPLLRHFTVIGFPDLLVSSNTVLSDLTIVHLRNTGDSEFPGVADCLIIFRCAPRLEEFDVELVPVRPPDITTDCILLANLNSLHITWMYHHNSADSLCLLNSIEAPFLKKLSVQFDVIGNDVEAIAILHDFISRCNISLMNLCICSSRYDLDIVSILRLSPYLAQLTLRCYQIPEAVIVGLSEKVVDEDGSVEFTLCPQLASIFLFAPGRWQGEVPIQPMVDVISCRWDVPASQRSLEAANINWLPPEAAPELKRMTMEGLDLRT